MAGQATRPYKSTLSGSIGAGMSSVFNPSGRKYYILEHKVSSRYHRAGEAQEIIVDQIELGRDSRCQVRFDDSFSTVSRRHAAIVKDGDNWKLVQISKTNSTLLNGHPVRTEWYLQNGDEIQLSVNGPKMGFIVPTGKKATVGSIGLTRRLSLFRQQALRPYKQAIAVLSVVLVLAVGGLTTWNFLMKSEFDKQIAAAQKNLEKLKGKNAELQKLISKSDKKIDSLGKIKPRVVVVRPKPTPGPGPQPINPEGLQKYEEDIFYLSAYVFAVYEGKPIPLETTNGNVLSWTGTGYLMTDGRFVTAKHCVEGWKFDSNEAIAKQLNALKDDTHKALFLSGLTNKNGVKLMTMIQAVSPSKQLKFNSEQFSFSRQDEKEVKISDELSRIKANGTGGSDWACVNVGQKGSIIGDASLSANLPAGVRLEVLGYPMGHKSEGGSCLYGSCQTSGRGLNGGLILITGKNYEHGNSGGPVFYNDNGTYKAVGIVSFSVYDNMGGITPLYNVK